MGALKMTAFERLSFEGRMQIISTTGLVSTDSPLRSIMISNLWTPLFYLVFIRKVATHVFLAISWSTACIALRLFAHIRHSS